MRPLLDADVFRYEIGFGAEMKDEEGIPQLRDFDFVSNLLESKVASIMEATDSTEPPIFYLTASEKLVDNMNKRLDPEDRLKYSPNFRIAKAVTRPYKGTRSGDKPYHYDNLTYHILNQYECKVAIGYEADDLIAIDHRLDPENTIIVTRDKDLRMIPGNHYGWPLGNRPGFGPRKIDELGYLDEPGKKLTGGGMKFFYAQMLMGDSVDNIPGLPKCGPVKAYKLLNDCSSIEELKETVCNAYEEYFAENGLEGWKDYYNEQAALLWIIRELDENGNPVEYDYIR